MPGENVKNILIIKLSSLGDVIHALPVLPALKALYPDAKLFFLVNKKYGEILRGNPYIDEILLFEREIWHRFFEKIGILWRLVKRIRGARFDLVIDLQGLLRSGLIAWISGGKRVIGFENSREGSPFFYHEKVAVSQPDMHAVDRYLLIPQFLGWKGIPEFIISSDPADEAFMDRFFRAEKVKTYLKIIGIHPTARWKTKEWPAEKFARLGELLLQTGAYEVVFLGSREDLPGVDKIVKQMKFHPIIGTGKFSLKQLAAFIQKSDLLVTNDSGPMHLAAALNIPVLALFGATDYRRTGPYGKEHEVISKAIPCSPCLRRACINPEKMACMERISPEEVFSRLNQMMEKRPHPSS